MLWVVDAGLMNRASPFRAGNCNRDPAFPAQFHPDCTKFVGIEALAWVLCKSRAWRFPTLTSSWR